MIDRKFRIARVWSNEQLRLIAPHCGGIVANVSAGEDVDKQGSHYRDYFTSAEEYWMTNFGEGKYRGFEGRDREILLDLTEDLPGDLKRRFDTVFNHTTMEHVFEVNKAFHNLCLMTRDLVVVVVPFCQIQHENLGYEDFWRFTPTCLRRLFSKEGMTVVYEAANNDFNAAVYILMVASKTPQKWLNVFPKWKQVEVAASWVGDCLEARRYLSTVEVVEPVCWRDIWVLVRRRLFGG